MFPFFSSTLIRDMLPIMNPDEDYLTIVAAEEKIASSEANRKKELEEAHAHLKCSCLDLEFNPVNY
jgi:kinetochore protein Spc24, fungi type